MTIEEIAKNKPDSLTGKAYSFALKAYSGHKRKSGELYFDHALATANTIKKWQLDEATIVASLLHDVLDLNPTLDKKIEQEFGKKTSFLVDGIARLDLIKYHGKVGKIENLRKMLIALSEDLRIIFIKLANRLEGMKTLNALPEDKRIEIARETEDVYAPIASLLGMQDLSGILLDLSFPHTSPGEYLWLIKNVKDKYEVREHYLKEIKPLIEKTLSQHNLRPTMIDFRAKRYNSLYKKLLRYEMDIERIYDLVAMRIIMGDVRECYETLGIIHEIWPPLIGRIKDYIASPKQNNYRSLHTTVFGPNDKFVEIQIRTKEMHEENENGIASHWLYKENRQDHKSFKQKIGDMAMIKQLRQWKEKTSGKSMKIDFFKEQVFAITPAGDVIDLPANSTPVDFAYAIHTEVGNTCVRSKINNKLSPLDSKIKSGDLVEIITQKNKKPSPDWLKFTKTQTAKQQIKLHIRKKNAKLLKLPPRKIG